MATRRQPKQRLPIAERITAGRRAAVIPHEFVLEALASMHPWTRPMFGCTAVYIEEKIVLVLRDRPTSPRDNGIWLATSREHHDSLRREFPRMRSIEVFETDVTSWQVLPSQDEDFEDLALQACKMIRAGDPRIGKTPKPKSGRSKKPLPKTKAAPRRRRSPAD
ncbi:MAG TPA: hypothetical protein VHZ99_14145 [Steroidobacteraceae bacterium]|jgi:hypothetical protein|nr:hypothetical protein [Steroidobacteraceae bacterium]